MVGNIGRNVSCVRCHMWEFLVVSRVPKVHICSKCLELQRLRAQVRQLEGRLEDAFLVRENEEIMAGNHEQEEVQGLKRREEGRL